ncbi:response regulator [Croceibacterium sp. TMG7-5b_MA50]|uniref:response regulator n=1 Tax=Croceibacterium sp. TMG7-5b_MA50 TaxID=3121290 RepID=UPI0032217C3C
MKLAGRRVLLVEDEPIIGFALEDMLQSVGACARLACSLDEGLRCVDECTWDAAILDVNLHGRQSFPLARALLAAQVPVVFATGNSLQSWPQDLAAVPTISKPYDLAAIRRAFEG